MGWSGCQEPRPFRWRSVCFKERWPWDQCPSHTLHHGFLKDGADVLDEVVVGLFRSPRSYTGEDVVEFSCHGGAQILRRVLDSCLRGGARLADPGEFTRRAFLNGKLDLTQAEAVGDLIAARSDAQRRLALEALMERSPNPFTPFAKNFWAFWLTWKPTWISWKTRFQTSRGPICETE
ncbi:MAG: hypothetical protein IPH59_12195 [bacterium]|nr:hypothetical protein [bacterium]